MGLYWNAHLQKGRHFICFICAEDFSPWNAQSGSMVSAGVICRLGIKEVFLVSRSFVGLLNHEMPLEITDEILTTLCNASNSSTWPGTSLFRPESGACSWAQGGSGECVTRLRPGSAYRREFGPACSGIEYEHYPGFSRECSFITCGFCHTQRQRAQRRCGCRHFQNQSQYCHQWRSCL